MIWGPRQVYVAHENLLSLCTTARLRANTAEMKRFMGGIRNRDGEVFNDSVAALIGKNPKLTVIGRLRKIRGLRGQLEQLGDVDVFVIDRVKRRVYVVECKDLEGARTPFEMSNEMSNLFRSTGSKLSIIEKHQRRVDWIRANLDEVLLSHSIERKGSWRAGSLIVIDRELFTPFLYTSPVPIVPVEQIRAVDAGRLDEFLRATASF